MKSLNIWERWMLQWKRRYKHREIEDHQLLFQEFIINTLEEELNELRKSIRDSSRNVGQSR